MSKKGIQGKDSFERMNFLYQASNLMLNVNKVLARHYTDLHINIAKKSVLRTDQAIKRTICKGCHMLLEPGTTARIRYIKKKNQHIRMKCLTCGTVKVFYTKPGHQTWSDNPESIIKPAKAVQETIKEAEPPKEETSKETDVIMCNT